MGGAHWIRSAHSIRMHSSSIVHLSQSAHSTASSLPQTQRPALPKITLPAPTSLLFCILYVEFLKFTEPVLGRLGHERVHNRHWDRGHEVDAAQVRYFNLIIITSIALYRHQAVQGVSTHRARSPVVMGGQFARRDPVGGAVAPRLTYSLIAATREPIKLLALPHRKHLLIVVARVQRQLLFVFVVEAADVDGVCVRLRILHLLDIFVPLHFLVRLKHKLCYFVNLELFDVLDFHAHRY